MALSAGNYQLVRAQAMQILNRWPRDEDGLILLASAMLFGPNPEPSASQILHCESFPEVRANGQT